MADNLKTRAIKDGSLATPAELMNEYAYCKKNPQYFIENYIILELPGRSVYMKMYEPQKKFLMSLFNDHHVISMKSRQIGISTIVQAYIVYACTFFNNVVVGVVSRDGDESTDFCRKVITMIKSLPVWLQPKFKKDTERTFILSNGCKFFASQVSLQNPGKLFRGKPVTIAVIDEAAHIEKIDEGFVGFGPSLIKSQTIAKQQGVPFGTIIISTPNKTTGVGRWFYNRWVSAHEANSVYVPHKIHWSEVDEFRNDKNWYSTQCGVLNNDPVAIAQELELKFVASTNSFFPPDIIEQLNEIKVKPCSKLFINKSLLNIWEKPDPEKFYLICVDTASISGNDYQTIVVCEYVSFDQVAEYRSKTRVDEFSTAVETVSKIFSKNLIIVENNSYGNQVIEQLTKRGFNYNIYQQKIRKSDVGTAPRFKYGLCNNAFTRPLMFDALFTYIKENPNLVKSDALALELIGLERKNGRPEAGPGMNDDLALALSFGCYVRMYDPPMNISVVAMGQSVDDIVDIVDMNDESSLSSAELTSILYDDSSTLQGVNKALNKHIKNKLQSITTDMGSNIDIMKIIGIERE